MHACNPNTERKDIGGMDVMVTISDIVSGLQKTLAQNKQPDVVGHTCNPSALGRQKQVDLWEFRVSLVYIESSRSPSVNW